MKVEPNVAIVKDLLVDNIDGHVIYFSKEATRIAKRSNAEHDKLDKSKPLVGMLVVFVKTGDHCYHDLCDMGASISVISFSLYQEVMNDIAPCYL
jgi:hypothetical protein